MPKKKPNNGDGNLRNGKGTALLIVDMISDFGFENGDELFQAALPAARQVAALKRRAAAAGIPVIYVNDNYKNWKEDFDDQVKSIERNSGKGKRIVELLKPKKEDYYVLKPQRSAFYETPLEVLLSSMNISDLIITGVTTDICVLFTAHDAYMRGYGLYVPADCTAAVEPGHHEIAIDLIQRVAEADIRPSEDLEI